MPHPHFAGVDGLPLEISPAKLKTLYLFSAHVAREDQLNDVWQVQSPLDHGSYVQKNPVSWV